MIRSVLAIDPGLTTGACRWNLGTGLESGFQLPHLQFLDWTWEYLNAWGAEAVVVMEEFRVNAATAKKTPAPWSLEVIGAVRWQAHRHGAPLVLQTASDAKSFVTNQRLREVGAWFPGLEHARDAARHLLLYLARTGWYDGNSLKTGGA